MTNESDVLGISLSPSSGAADQFALNEGGEYYAVGAGKGISGFRADLGLCDDLFGNREDAWLAEALGLVCGRFRAAPEAEGEADHDEHPLARA